jgi:hypothetical protein
VHATPRHSKMKNLLFRLKSLIGPPTPPKQQFIDWEHAWTMMKCAEHFRSPETLGELTGQHIDDYIAQAETLVENHKIGESVQDELDKQIVSLFKALKKYEDEGGTTKQVKKTPAISFSDPPSHKQTQSLPNITLHDAVGFEFEIKESSISGAGKGVFLKHGTIVPGTGLLVHVLC